MTDGLVRSTWARPVPDGPLRARNWHLQQWTRWLTRAGAEPRLCLILCAGDGAAEAIRDACADAAIDIAPAPVTAERPLAPNLLAHRGDHFNATLFLMDGLAGADPDTLAAINGQRGQLRRMATWVGVLVQDLATLNALQQHAPGLMHAIQRTALVLGDHPPAGRPHPQALDAWRRRGQIAALAFAEACGTHAPDYDDFSRLVRAGYAGLRGFSNPERVRAQALWSQAGGPLGLALHEGDHALVDMAVRHARLTPDQRAILAPRASRAAQVAIDHAPAPLADWTDSTDRLQAQVVRAQQAAEAGDLEACLRALQAAEPPPAGPMPELAVQVLHTQITVLEFMGDRAGALAALDRMDAQVERLASPFFAAQARAARARFIQPLDPTRARLDLLEAERLLRAHGYPAQAAELNEALSS